MTAGTEILRAMPEPSWRPHTWLVWQLAILAAEGERARKELRDRPEARKAVEAHLRGAEDRPAPENLRHMAVVASGRRDLIAAHYAQDGPGSPILGGTFEEGSGPYSGYQGAAALVAFLLGDPEIKRAARAQLRVLLAWHALHLSRAGQVVLAAGRCYADPDQETGSLSEVANYRQDLLFGRQPRRGRKSRWWGRETALSAWPWRLAGEEVVTEIFEAAEITALRDWRESRWVSPALVRLLAEIRTPSPRVLQAWPSGRWGPRGHVSVASRLRSYAEGKNSAQPVAWAVGEDLGFEVEDPPVDVTRQADGWLVRSERAEKLVRPPIPRGAPVVELVFDERGVRGDVPA